MSKTREYKGIAYAVPNTDDGAWRWVIYPTNGVKGFAAINEPPRSVYATHDGAVLAAKHAIDAVLARIASAARIIPDPVGR